MFESVLNRIYEHTCPRLVTQRAAGNWRVLAGVSLAVAVLEAICFFLQPVVELNRTQLSFADDCLVFS